jgi:hypothetical protein
MGQKIAGTPGSPVPDCVSSVVCILTVFIRNVHLVRPKFVIANFFSDSQEKTTNMSVDTIYADIDSSTHLAQMTRDTHKHRLKRLFETPPFPKKILTKVIPQLTEKDTTRLNLMQTILSVMKLSPTFRQLISEPQRKNIFRESEVLKAQQLEKRNSGETRDDDISWEDLLACESSFPPKSEAMLIHRLYTHLPTVRADFTPLKIVKTKKEAALDTSINYFVLDKKKPIFILNEYKTAARFGQQIFPLPQSIVDLVPSNQDYLFEGSTPGQPVLPNTLVQKVIRSYSKYCNRKVTINTLRRAYALHTKAENGADVDAAISQGHSVTTHGQYAARG